MTRLRITIAAALFAAVAMIAPAASQAADSDLAKPRALQIAVVELGVDELVVTKPGNALISLLGWGWGG